MKRAVSWLSRVGGRQSSALGAEVPPTRPVPVRPVPADLTLPSAVVAETRHQLDPAQATALAAADALARAAAAGPPPVEMPGRPPRRGLYLWGPPGRGKTFLMDCTRKALVVPAKRMHFHEFFQTLHRELHTRFAGRPEPVRAFVQETLAGVEVLCFDEFHVHDIADAMLLQSFLDALMAQPIYVVLTSNYPPHDLLSDPRFHERFSLGIALLDRHFDVIGVDNGRDYREFASGQASNFVHPLHAGSDRFLANAFRHAECAPASDGTVSLRPGGQPTVLLVNERSIPCHRLGRSAVWFTFDALCGTERSYVDYLSLTDRFSTLVLSGITAAALRDSFSTQRFVWLIDVLYDRGTRLVLSSERPITDLFSDAGGAHDTFRTLSRLREMEGRSGALGPEVSHPPEDLCAMPS